ncbi:lipopolysaccharide biosynthesis protein [Ruicaihuangia caeni]|uniref:Lipopolysaccharide biosynthesis protein n=1 Tax=Ruicaihuangia caeni TaxID=3042517 RepID=A0AAW6T693_9MICO|nr:lipopolysaccharide biosynthesis protein [Klugiella sp. YN-L-19]MDI2097600.1 lipopolysaccharide biosynthesis protein [Klugiella sp. YN-L-19]
MTGVRDGRGDQATLAARIRRGSFWGGVNIALSRTLQFVTTLIVARIIAPDEFGALAVALVAQTIALNITELGTTAAIARGDRDPDRIAPTVFTISLVTGAVLTTAMVLVAPWLSAALGDPSATPVVQVMAISVMLASFASVPTALVWRDFLQRQRVIVDLTAILVTLALVVPLALAGWGAMALAWSRVAGQLVSTIGYWIVTPRRYLPGWNRAELSFLMRLGMPLALSNLVAFVMLNVDYIVVGRMLGPEQLGLYLLAFNLAALPSTVITTLIRTVAVPAFGRLHAAGTLGELVPQFIRGVAWITFPICALVAALGAPLMHALYGERWLPGAVALLGLGVFAASRILSELFADLAVGAGQTRGLLWVQVLWIIALVPAMIAGVAGWGIAGAGYAHAAVCWFVVVPAYLWLLSRIADVPVSAQLRAFSPLLLAALAAGAVAAWAGSLIDSPWAALIVAGCSGLAVYLLLTAQVGRSVVRSIKEAR